VVLRTSVLYVVGSISSGIGGRHKQPVVTGPTLGMQRAGYASPAPPFQTSCPVIVKRPQNLPGRRYFTQISRSTLPIRFEPSTQLSCSLQTRLAPSGLGDPTITHLGRRYADDAASLCPRLICCWPFGPCNPHGPSKRGNRAGPRWTFCEFRCDRAKRNIETCAFR
jgi:hypothetical protein